MAKKAAAPNFQPMLEETGDALTPEEQAAQDAEERGEAPVVVAPEETPAEGEETPETAAPVEGAEKGGKGKTPKVVPYDRLAEVIGERNQLRQTQEQMARELADQREKWGRLEERQKLANEAQQRAQQAQAAAERAAQRPDPDVDPAGARAWDAVEDAKAARAEVQRLTEFVNGRSQELQGWTQQQQMAGYVQQAATRGRMQHSDWDARVDFARAERTKMWMGVGHSEEAAKRIVANEEMALVTSAAQSGADLVPVIANMTTQWGYKPPAANGNARANGNVKLDQISAGQKVQGLGRTQSAESPAQLPWQTMDDTQFANFIVGMDDNDYIEMTRNKEFNKRVTQLDTKGA